MTKIPLPLDRNFVMSFLVDGSWAQNRVSLEIAKEISGIHAVISKRPKLQGPRATFRVLQETAQFQCTGLDCTALTGPTRRGGSLPIFSICPRPVHCFPSGPVHVPPAARLSGGLCSHRPARRLWFTSPHFTLAFPTLSFRSHSIANLSLSPTSISLAASPPHLVQFQ